MLGQIPHCTELNASQMPGDCPGGMGGFGIDWHIIETINMFAVPLLLGDIWIGCALKEKGRLFGHKTLQARLQTSATVVGSRYSKLSGKRKIVRKSQKYSNDRKVNQPDPTVFPLHGSLGKNLQKFSVYLGVKTSQVFLCFVAIARVTEVLSPRMTQNFQNIDVSFSLSYSISQPLGPKSRNAPRDSGPSGCERD